MNRLSDMIEWAFDWYFSCRCIPALIGIFVIFGLIFGDSTARYFTSGMLLGVAMMLLYNNREQ